MNVLKNLTKKVYSKDKKKSNWAGNNASPKSKKGTRMGIKESDQLNELVGLMRDKWQDNAVEAFAGLLSTVVSEKQLQVLIDDLRQK